MTSKGEVGDVNGPRRYHPVVDVQAWQVTAANAADVARWCRGRVFRGGSADADRFVDVPGDGACAGGVSCGQEGRGSTFAHVGDWVIQGVTGEFFTVRDGEFRWRYRDAAADDPRASRRGLD